MAARMGARYRELTVTSPGEPPRERASVDHELQEIAVRIAGVHARCRRLPAAFPAHRTLFDRGARAVEQGAERLGRSLPHEAEVAAGWLRGRGPEGEPVALPHLGAMEVDHLVP